MGKPHEISLKKIELVKKHYKIEGRLTVRRCWYIWRTQHLIVIEGKTKKQLDSLYKKQSEYLTNWREKNYIPPHMIIDHTRQVIEPSTFEDFEDAFDYCYETFSMNSMEVQDRYVEVWLEKETMTSTYEQICLNHDVPLVVSRGFTSYSCKYEACQRFSEIAKPITILVCGDHDAEGLHIPVAVENFVSRYIPELDIIFKRVLLTEDDFHDLEAFQERYSPHKDSLKIPHVKSYIDRYGPVKLEVEAMAFEVQKQRLIEALGQEIDFDVVEKVEKASTRNKKAWKSYYYEE